MPRVLTGEKAPHITVTTVEKDTSYNLNGSFEAEHDSTRMTYDSQNELVLWSDLCGKNSVIDPIVGIAGSNYCRFATDRSLNGNDNKIYSQQTILNRRFSETNLTYILSLLDGDLSERITPESIDMCGDPCVFFNLSLASQGSDECEMVAVGADNFYIPHNTDLTHTNDSNTNDQAFSISLWYYPVDYETNSNRLYDRGGLNRLFAPTILHKTFEYALYIRDCGKLEFVLYDVDIDVNTIAEFAGGPIMSYSGTAATLTSRSHQNVLKPGYWNHITITYDGSATREGMNIYVNCSNETNRSDVPASRSGAKTLDLSSSALSASDLNTQHLAFMTDLYYTDDNEDPSAYTNMKTHSTPLVFASSAYVTEGISLRTSGGSENNLTITDPDMTIWNASQLPLTFLFDFAMWNKALDSENIIAICAATRECPIRYTSSVVSYRDSGYINLSPKVLNKIKDQKRNNGSVIDRIGDRSDRRVKERAPFEDQNVLLFGRQIKDEFKRGRFKFNKFNLSEEEVLSGLPVAGIIPDGKIWISQNALIKREKKTNADQELITDSALTLSSEGESWIQTTSKVNNAILYYDLILGPHNKGTGNLNLKSIPPSGANLFIEIQAQDGADWQIIKTHTVENEFRAQDKFYSPQFNSGIILNERQHQFRRSFSLHFTQFSSAGESYKIRFRTSNNCWGIGRIEILSANQKIRPPLLIDHESYAGSYIDKNVIATPHTRSDLETTGRSVSGISDSSIYFSDEKTQTSLPFNDTLSLPFDGKTFFKEGVNAEIIKSFSSPLKDKTSFTIALNSSQDTDIGFINPIAGGSNTVVSSFAQPLFAAWDHKNSQWKSPNASLDEFSMGFKPCFLESNLENQLNYHKQPFGTIDLIGTGSDESFEQFGSEVLSSYNQPVTSFGFPHETVYGKPGTIDFDDLVKMKNYITKPFLLEKVVIEFDAKFEFSTAQKNAFRLMYVSGTTGNPSDRHYDVSSVMIPSFYILNVKKNAGRKFSNEVLIDDDDELSRLNITHSSFDYRVATNKDKIGSDLITYGQMTMFITGSDEKIKFDDLINDGLGRDAIYDIAKLNGQTAYSKSDKINNITSSFLIEIPVRNMPRTEANQRSFHKEGSTANYFALLSNNPSGGRSLPFISSSFENSSNVVTALPSIDSRGIVNSLSSVDKKNEKDYFLGNSAQASDPYKVKTSGFRIENNKTSISPYLLFPEDTISFAFAYPAPLQGIFMQPDAGETDFNKMTLGGNYKVHFYGSQIKDGKEFHETVNQALTTVEISEPIGCESVVDKFNIASKDEYYGTYLDEIPVLATTRQDTDPPTSLSSRNVYSFENRNTGYGSTQFIKKANTPESRIGLKTGSKIHHFETYKVASSSIDLEGVPHNFVDTYLDPVAQIISGTFNRNEEIGGLNTYHFYRKSFTFPFTEHYNNLRRYADEGNNQQNVSRENYIFSFNHFGFYADIIDQAKDSRYKVIELKESGEETGRGITRDKDELQLTKKQILSSPVSVKFVSASLNNKNIKTYYSTGSDNSFSSFNKTIDASLTYPAPFDDVI